MNWFSKDDIGKDFKVLFKDEKTIIGKLVNIENINIIESEGSKTRFSNDSIARIDEVITPKVENKSIKQFPGIRIVSKKKRVDTSTKATTKHTLNAFKDKTELSYDSQDLMKSIVSNWQLDAKQENNKYFYNIKEAKLLMEGRKSYVIGRKGTGKTAICEYLLNYDKFNVFSEKLSFKNFPFNSLYNLENIKNYKEPNQYITIWKYLIYSNVCKLMAQNEAIDTNIRQELESLYPNEMKRNLGRTISRWTSAEFGATIFGNGGSIKVSREIQNSNLSWIEKVDILEDIILDYSDDSKYFIIFDELDEDYGDIKEKDNHREYKNLLTSLFKAVQEVRSIFKQTKIQILPVVFLRDDIYRFLHDADKNKWRDFEIEIEWSSEKLKKLIAFRLSQDIDNGKNILEFSDIWNKLFSISKIATGKNNKRKRNSFDFISNSTQLRPRDYIRYISVCSEAALDRNEKVVSPDTIKFADRGFSNYLKDEIRDEIYPLLPEIDQLFQILTTIRKPIFTYGEFKVEYEKNINSGSIVEKNLDFILATLFNFSIIGNQHVSQKTRTFFKYKQTNMNINKSEALVIHRGLLKSLQIF